LFFGKDYDPYGGNWGTVPRNKRPEGVGGLLGGTVK